LPGEVVFSTAERGIVEVSDKESECPKNKRPRSLGGGIKN
jgi:hypothetical protein